MRSAPAVLFENILLIRLRVFHSVRNRITLRCAGLYAVRLVPFFLSRWEVHRSLLRLSTDLDSPSTFFQPSRAKVTSNEFRNVSIAFFTTVVFFSLFQGILLFALYCLLPELRVECACPPNIFNDRSTQVLTAKIHSIFYYLTVRSSTEAP